ncbi:hypothetical protein Mapa_006966 [Marchantia paleacea]|nr:hypothetical protein Mapa_006966 [Marchantia paleacea]
MKTLKIPFTFPLPRLDKKIIYKSFITTKLGEVSLDTPHHESTYLWIRNFCQ